MYKGSKERNREAKGGGDGKRGGKKRGIRKSREKLA